MQITRQNRIAYGGWGIQICQIEEGFYFECYAPGLSADCNDGDLYPDQETALKAAREFVKREQAILALIEIVNQWHAQGLVSEAEYWALTDFA